VLPGIGPHYAQSIIDARPFGPSFGSKKDLLKKELIPQETYDKIQSRVTANGPRNNLCLKGLNTEGVEQLPKARRL
jgi:hypothetical protein